MSRMTDRTLGTVQNRSVSHGLASETSLGGKVRVTTSTLVIGIPHPGARPPCEVLSHDSHARRTATIRWTTVIAPASVR